MDMQTVITQYDDHTLSVLDRLVESGRYPNRQAAIEDAIRQKVEAIERFEADVRAGMDDLDAGRFCSHEELIAEMSGNGVPV